jgi:mono/diheme cytochrome c family protein
MKVKFFALAMSLVFGIALIFSMSSANLPEAKPWKTPDKFAKMKAPKSSPESIAKGKELYTKHCKSCHGASGKGDGTKAAGLKTTINSFGDKTFKGLGDGDKYYRSFIGRDEMPNFEKKLVSEDERWAVVHYINTL